MELQEFIKKFAELFEDTDPNEIQADTNFRELYEWSSLTALSVMAMVADEYEILLKEEDIRKAGTVNELYQILKNKR
nr:acyl carrier protein [Bacteroides intestinalis]